MKSWPLLILAGIVLAVLLCVPVTAEDNLTALHNREIRQVHLAWTALDKDYEMNAAITYCNTLYGADTSSMSGLLEEFRAEVARIPTVASDRELDTLITDMRNTTAKFRADTFDVMTSKQGKWAELNRQIALVKDNNPYILEKKDAYWSVRIANNLADFDAWVQEGQQHLDALKKGGYDTTSAQRALDVFASKRPDLQEAIASKSESAILSVNQQNLQLSEEFIKELARVQEQVPDSTRFRFFIEQGYRAVEVADRVNIDLVPILIDIGAADPVLSKTKTDLAAAIIVLNSGKLEATKIPLKLVQKDLVDLAQAYRDVAHGPVLPTDLSAELDSLIRRLENTADEMGAAL